MAKSIIAWLAFAASAAASQRTGGSMRLLRSEGMLAPASAPSAADALAPMGLDDAGMAPAPGGAAAGSCTGAGANSARYNFAIGDAAAMVLSDGTLGGSVGEVMAYREAVAVQRRALRAARQPTDFVSLGKNVLYVDTGADRILFDTGIGADRGGTLFAELSAANIEPATITKVMITHGHGDHIGGILRNNSDPSAGLVFTNAEYFISRVEWDYWTAETVDPRDFTQERIDEQAAGAKATFGAIEDRVTLFEYNTTIVPGITAVQTTYHTPGMAVYLLDLAPGTEPPFAVPGDSFTQTTLSVENPWFRSTFDSLPEAGPAGRYALLDDLSARRARMVLYHGAFPGVGEAAECGMEFRWYNVDYGNTAGVETSCPV